MKKIVVFTSGGDSPGMNACIRAVVKTAIHNGLEVIGALQGYNGLINNNFIPLGLNNVSNIINRGGTLLKTARSSEFRTLEGQQKALKNLEKHAVDGIIAIGGDGTLKGALEFSKISNIPCIGCPGTIDNDLIGTDFTIGYDTAINTVVEAVDKIRDTAESHDRIFFVEVMGRDAGLIALRGGIAVGAEAIVIPEISTDVDLLIEQLNTPRPHKTSRIVMVAEGDSAGGAFQLADIVREKLPNSDIRVSILGHMQRGGSPTAMERVRSSRIGFNAVKALLTGENNKMIGIKNDLIVMTPFDRATKHRTELMPDLLDMMQILSV